MGYPLPPTIWPQPPHVGGGPIYPPPPTVGGGPIIPPPQPPADVKPEHPIVLPPDHVYPPLKPGEGVAGQWVCIAVPGVGTKWVFIEFKPQPG